jgi:hypothetical protein
MVQIDFVVFHFHCRISRIKVPSLSNDLLVRTGLAIAQRNVNCCVRSACGPEKRAISVECPLAHQIRAESSAHLVGRHANQEFPRT